MQKLPSVIEMTSYQRLLSAPPDDIDVLHEFLQGIWDENPQIPMRDRFSFETALIELASNIILYSEAPSGVACEIRISTSADRIDAIVSDNGELVDLALDEHMMPDEYAEAGRGIPMIKALVNHLSYDRDGNLNKWTITRNLTP